MTKAIDDVLAERRRQIKSEGWGDAHDDEQTDFALSQAASAYAHFAATQNWRTPDDYASRPCPMPGAAQDQPSWPKSWSRAWWKPRNPRRDLVRAAALLIAEIERLDRRFHGYATQEEANAAADACVANTDGGCLDR